MHVAILIREHTFAESTRSTPVARHATMLRAPMLRGGVLLQLCGQPALSSLATNKAAALCTLWNAVQQAASTVFGLIVLSAPALQLPVARAALSMAWC